MLTAYAAFFAALQFVIHLAGSMQYGFHRDELLYLALGEHPDWGFKEVPPFIAFLAWLLKHSIGDSLFAVRLFPIMAAALIVYLSCRLTAAMGGRAFAIVICGSALVFAPSFLASGYLFQPVVFDQLWWVLSAVLMVKYINTRRLLYLYGWGAACGFGMLTKYTMAFYALAMLVGLLLSGQRRIFLNRHFWLASLAGLLVFSPNLIWQITHHFPVVHHMKELRETQLEYLSPVSFFIQQLLIHGTGVLVYLPGLLFLLAAFRLRNYRFLAFALFGTLILLVLGNGKTYYAFGAYPPIFAAGGYACERIIKQSFAPLRWGFVLLLLPNLVFLPLAVPVLPIKNAVAYFSWVKKAAHVRFPFVWEDQREHPLTQDYADMYGWEELARKVADVYKRLPAEQKRRTIIFADNYGQAGAIDYFGKKYGLPKVVSLSSSFAIWAPPELRAENMIYINDEVDFRDAARSAKKVGEISSVYAREKGMPVYWIEGLKPAIKKVYHQQWLDRR